MRWKGSKGKCWEVVREIVKLRDGDKCISCPKKGAQWKYDTGHYYPVALVGSNNTLSWDTRYIRRQCSFCNGSGQGMQAEFKEALRSILGQPALIEFETRRHKVDPIKNWDVMLESLKKELEKFSTA